MSLAVAKSWYEVEIVSKSTARIIEAHVHPWAAGNIWFIEGTERCLVFDTGTGLGDLVKTVSTLTNKPVTAIVSTGYYDHAGGLNQFEHRAVHRQEADRVRYPTPRSTVSDKYLKQTSLKAIPYANFLAKDYVMPGCDPTELLNDGDCIDIGDRCFEVLHTPGVTDGSIVLYEAKSALLFSGESLSDSNPFYFGEPKDETNDANYQTRLSSIKHLMRLDVSMVYPGHHAPFDGTRLRQIIKQQLDS